MGVQFVWSFNWITFPRICLVERIRNFIQHIRHSRSTRKAKSSLVCTRIREYTPPSFVILLQRLPPPQQCCSGISFGNWLFPLLCRNSSTYRLIKWTTRYVHFRGSTASSHTIVVNLLLLIHTPTNHWLRVIELTHMEIQFNFVSSYISDSGC